MYLSLVGLCLLAVVGLYFVNNPLHHGGWFLTRRFINWFPLGMTYAFLYMARYNLSVAKNALGAAMTNEDFGLIFAAGTATYAFSFLLNGPLVDRIGGKRGILLAAGGTAVANLLLGVLTYLTLTGRLHGRMVVAFSGLYALNMYFQSFGAVSVIKVKAYWFHVRERGVFGAIFGALVSFGVYFAFDWSEAILDLARTGPRAASGWLAELFRAVFAVSGSPGEAVWAVFFVPAAILLGWCGLNVWLVKDTPEEAGFPPFDPADASSGHMDEPFSARALFKSIFTSRLMLLFAAVELTSGVMRNGVLQWYTVYAKEMPQAGAEFVTAHWGLLLCLFGIIGGFAGGLLSDRCFQSRRGPPTVLLCASMVVLAGMMALGMGRAPLLVGGAALLIALAVTGVHTLLTASAAADFGGRKATATSAGIVDGCVYLGSSLQSVCVGHLVGFGWVWWPLFLAPFAALGAVIAWQFWSALPMATRRYLNEVEHKPVPGKG